MPSASVSFPRTGFSESGDLNCRCKHIWLSAVILHLDKHLCHSIYSTNVTVSEMIFPVKS